MAAGQKPKFFATGNRATGFIAFGNIATGVIAVGNVTRGFIAIGNVAIGVIAIGNVGFGVIGLGASVAGGFVAYGAASAFPIVIGSSASGMDEAFGPFAALIAFPVFLATAVLAPQIVAVFFGPKWTESVAVMQLLALFGLIQVLTYLNGTTIKALGKPGWLVVIVGITAALKVVAFLIAVQYGLVAVAVAAVFVGWAVAPLYYWGVRKLVAVDLRGYWTSLRVPVAGSILSSATMLGFRYLLDGAGARPLVVLAVAGAAGAAVYYGAVRLMAPPLAAEVRDLVGRGLPSRRFGRPRKVLVGGDS